MPVSVALVVRVAIMAAAGSLAGVVAHECTHILVAKALGARVVRYALFPPSPEVVFEAQTPGVTAAIRAAPVLLSVPVLVVAIVVPSEVSYPRAAAVIALAIAYLPRSQSDWHGFEHLMSAVAGAL